MKQYTAVHFDVEETSVKEILEYKLSVLGVESIEEREDQLIAYFESSAWPQAEEELLEYLIESEIEYFFALVKNENWNAQWEASFEPVNINDFCYVRAPFHEASSNTEIIDIILEPKMAFGTAHHETTFMMMSQMQALDFQGKKVFDFGCGTAILSVLAEKLGASEIYAIDIEENAVENASYNAEINQCSKIVCEERVLEQVQVRKYDIILANINRQVLLNSAAQLPSFLDRSGVLLLSGILEKDEALVTEVYEEAGFKIVESVQKGEWKCLKLIN